jgi:hypothetical protein
LERLLAGLETLGMKRSAAPVPMLGDGVVHHCQAALSEVSELRRSGDDIVRRQRASDALQRELSNSSQESVRGRARGRPRRAPASFWAASQYLAAITNSSFELLDLGPDPLDEHGAPRATAWPRSRS